MPFNSTQRLQGPVLYLGAPLKVNTIIFRRNPMHDQYHFLSDGDAPYIAARLHPGIFGQIEESNSTFFLLLGRILLKFCMRKGNC